MTISPDLLKAFIEGKLAPEDASGVAAQLARDPDLAAYVADQKATQAALASPVLTWLDVVRRRAAGTSANWITVGAMAAGILLGVLLAASFGIGADLRGEDGALLAQGELGHVLSTVLAPEQGPAERADARVGASFWSKNGAFCRSFATRAQAGSALAGIACRERGAWRLMVLATVEARDVAGARLATADLPPSVRGV